MKFKFFIIFFFLFSCTNNFNNLEKKKSFNSVGFAYVYNEEDFDKELIKDKIDNTSLYIAHNKLKKGSLIKIVNIKTKDSIILKTSKTMQYPEFYKILITKAVAQKLNLLTETPLVEITELKKNKSFVAEKTIIFTEEKTIHDKAPVELVTIDNISKANKKNFSKVSDKFYITIAEFYSKDSANFLKQRIINEISDYDSKKLFINSKKSNKTTLISGPYKSINLIKNDYIKLKNFGFEDLDISTNE